MSHYPILNRITGKTSAGYLLSQIIHWHTVKKGAEFYKTDKEFCQELEMGPSEFRAAKKLLTDMQAITIVRRGIPSTSYYRVNMDHINSLMENATSLSANPANCSDDVSPTNSVDTTEIPVDTTLPADQGALPEILGKTPLARLVSVYSLKFNELYGFNPSGLNWAMLGRNFKQALNDYSEWQIAAMILLHFDWHGASGEDDFTYNRLADRCFPLEWVPKQTNAYRAFIQNTLGVDWDDNAAVKKHVSSIIKPLYVAQHVKSDGEN